MGSAEDAYEARRRTREYVDTRERDARIAKAKRRFPALHAKAVANLKRQKYPEDVKMPSRFLTVNGRKRVGWTLRHSSSGGWDGENPPPSPGFYLLGEGEIVRGAMSYKESDQVVSPNSLGIYLVAVVEGLERVAAYPYDPRHRPLWHRILR